MNTVVSTSEYPKHGRKSACENRYGFDSRHLKAKDYHPELVKDYCLKLSEEVGELARAVRKDLRPAEKEQIKDTVEEEIWDVIYYALAIANCYDIEMEEIIKQKEKINNIKYNTNISLEII